MLFLKQTLAEIDKDRWFYCACAVYAEAVWALARALGEPDRFRPLLYIAPWMIWISAAASVGVLALGTVSLFTRQPMSSLLRRLSFMTGPRFLAGVVLCLALLATQGVFTTAKTFMPQLSGGFLHDQGLARLDASVLGQDAWRYLTFLDPLTPLMQGVYSLSWMFAYAALALGVTISRRLEPLRAHYLWSMLLCMVVLGNGLALMGISAGPLFYQQVTGDPRFAPLTDSLETWRHSAGSAIGIRDYLWQAHISGLVGQGGGISAFPSMHISMATLFALLARRIHPRLGVAAIIYGVIIYAGSIHLGFHYAFDGYVSLVMTLLIWRVVGMALAKVPALSGRRQTVLARGAME